jgi:hypothetical protein
MLISGIRHLPFLMLIAGFQSKQFLHRFLKHGCKLQGQHGRRYIFASFHSIYGLARNTQPYRQFGLGNIQYGSFYLNPVLHITI